MFWLLKAIKQLFGHHTRPPEMAFSLGLGFSLPNFPLFLSISLSSNIVTQHMIFKRPMSLLTITSPLDLASLGCGSGCHFVNIGIAQYDYSFIFSIAHRLWFLWYDVWITQRCLSMCAQCLCDWGDAYTHYWMVLTPFSLRSVYIYMCVVEECVSSAELC